MSKKHTVIDRQKTSIRTEKSKKAIKKRLLKIPNTKIMICSATLYEMFLVESSASKDQIKKTATNKSVDAF